MRHAHKKVRPLATPASPAGPAAHTCKADLTMGSHCGALSATTDDSRRRAGSSRTAPSSSSKLLAWSSVMSSGFVCCLRMLLRLALLLSGGLGRELASSLTTLELTGPTSSPIAALSNGSKATSWPSRRRLCSLLQHLLSELLLVDCPPARSRT